MGSTPWSRSCFCRISMCERRLAFSPSTFSVWPRDLMRPVMRSVVRHSVLFWAQGEQPPGWGSQRIFLTCVAHARSQPESRRGRQGMLLQMPTYLASVAGLAGAIRGALPPRAGLRVVVVGGRQVVPERLRGNGRRPVVVAGAFCRHRRRRGRGRYQT